MKIIFKIFLSIKTRLLNLVLTFFGICRIVSHGYEKENFYKNIINEELENMKKILIFGQMKKIEKKIFIYKKFN